MSKKTILTRRAESPELFDRCICMQFIMNKNKCYFWLAAEHTFFCSQFRVRNRFKSFSSNNFCSVENAKRQFLLEAEGLQDTDSPFNNVYMGHRTKVSR